MIGTGVIRLLWFLPVIPVKVAESQPPGMGDVTTSDGVLTVKSVLGSQSSRPRMSVEIWVQLVFVKQLVRIYGDTVLSLLERHYLDEDGTVWSGLFS